jgi:hypothetical protein
MPKYERCR